METELLKILGYIWAAFGGYWLAVARGGTRDQTRLRSFFLTGRLLEFSAGGSSRSSRLFSTLDFSSPCLDSS